MLLATTVGACSFGGTAAPPTAHPPAGLPTASALPAPTGPCVAAQVSAGAPGTTSSLPVIVVANNLATAEDLLVDGDRLLVGQYSSGRITSIGDQPTPHQLPGTVGEVEGMTRLGGTLYVASQQTDSVVALADDGTTRTVLQLRPVSGVEGLDQISTDGTWVLVPDSARGTLLWVGTNGTIQRSVGGFARPTGAWPGPDGSVLLADENGGRVYSIAADGTRTVLASGLPLDDDVARSGDGRVFTISITLGGLYEIKSGGAVQAVITGLAQPQGLEVDHAGNPIVTEYDRGRVDKVVETFALAAPSDPVSVQPNQPLCVQLLRAPALTDAVVIDAGTGYRVTVQPGSGNQGEILPAACAQPECAVRVTVRSGDRSDSAWLRYRAGS